MLTVEEVAQELGISPVTVRHHIYNGRLQASKFGWQLAITREDLDEYKANRRKPGRPRKSEQS